MSLHFLQFLFFVQCPVIFQKKISKHNYCCERKFISCSKRPKTILLLITLTILNERLSTLKNDALRSAISLLTCFNSKTPASLPNDQQVAISACKNFLTLRVFCSCLLKFRSLLVKKLFIKCK